MTVQSVTTFSCIYGFIKLRMKIKVIERGLVQDGSQVINNHQENSEFA